MRLSLNLQIVIGAALGVLIGLLISIFPETTKTYQATIYIAGLAGDIFINLLKMILIPLVFSSIVVGIANLRSHAQMHKVWPTALIYFVSTTSLAIILGLIVVNVFKPGVGVDITLWQDSMAASQHLGNTSVAGHLEQILTNLFQNPVTSMANNNILPTVIFALFMGIALVQLDTKAKYVIDFMEQIFNMVMLMVQWIIRLAPIGIMGLLIELVATQDFALLSSLGKFIFVVLGATLFHGFITLPFILWIVTKRSPLLFINHIKEALITALSTSSSSATLPLTINCVENNAKVDKNIAGFVLPLGATINMDGTALYEAIAALFVANLVGIELSIIQQCVVFITAMIAAMGAPGIPSAGMVTMVMVLQSVGLPGEAIAILLPIDRLLDSVRTMVNVKGDCVGSAIVEKLVSTK